MAEPRRPVLRWHGGKWLLASWIIQHFPPHRVYVEPFGGAASVLLRKKRAYAEVYNDLDREVVTLFRVLREPEKATRLVDLLRLTPFARAEFVAAYDEPADDIERARQLIVRSFMGFGSDAPNKNKPTGFRANSNKSGTIPAHDWVNYPKALLLIAERLMGVIVENRNALDLMLQHDSDQTLHYVDPPYLPETRGPHALGRPGKFKTYVHELTREDHAELLAALRDLRGMVVLSGYPAALYDEALPDWRRIERAALADGARPRTEVLWLNPACCAALDAGGLFRRVAV